MLKLFKEKETKSEFRLTKLGMVIAGFLILIVIYSGCALIGSFVVSNTNSNRVADSLYEDIEPLKVERYRIKIREGRYTNIEIRTYPSGLMCTLYGGGSIDYTLNNCIKRYGDYK